MPVCKAVGLQIILGLKTELLECLSELAWINVFTSPEDFAHQLNDLGVRIATRSTEPGSRGHRKRQDK